MGALSDEPLSLEPVEDLAYAPEELPEAEAATPHGFQLRTNGRLPAALAWLPFGGRLGR